MTAGWGVVRPSPTRPTPATPLTPPTPPTPATPPARATPPRRFGPGRVSFVRIACCRSRHPCSSSSPLPGGPSCGGTARRPTARPPARRPARRAAHERTGAHPVEGGARRFADVQPRLPRHRRVSGNSAAAAPPASSTPAPGATSGKPSTTTPALPAGEVGQSARIEQTGSLDLTVAKGALSATMAKLSSLAADVRRLRGQPPDAVGRHGRWAAERDDHAADPGGELLGRPRRCAVPGQGLPTHDQGHRRHRPVRRSAGSDHLAGGQPAAVPDHHDQGVLHRRRAGRAGTAGQPPVADPAAAGAAPGPLAARRRTPR